MLNKTEIQQLVSSAVAGNAQSQEEFFKKLSVRFTKLIALELRKYPILTDEADLAEKTDEICRYAIQEVQKWCPLCDPNFSLVRVMNVLHNVLDTCITNWLANISKSGNKEAEYLLFMILRKKLLERVSRKRGKDSKYENE